MVAGGYDAVTVRILIGDVRQRLADLPDGSVQCVVTSPPYFGLRDYGTAQWDGGDPACDHRNGYVHVSKTSTLYSPGEKLPGSAAVKHGEQIGKSYRDQCRKCGAVRIDQQIGLEPTLAEYVQTLVAVFRDVRRVLHPTGTVWCNLGDSFADKQLQMVPARVALALQDDGWWLRSEIVWHKKAPMPESVTDRPTSAHEKIFLLTKSAKYFYDAIAVAEESLYGPGCGWDDAGHEIAVKTKDVLNPAFRAIKPTRNQRNVWHMATESFPEAHFATFPSEIPRRCIKAGTSEKGQCPACGAPWVRVVAPTERYAKYLGKGFTDHADDMGAGRMQNRGVNRQNEMLREGISGKEVVTTGWQPTCTCNAAVVPQVVLDPFLGSGTTLLVADQ